MWKSKSSSNTAASEPQPYPKASEYSYVSRSGYVVPQQPQPLPQSQQSGHSYYSAPTSQLPILGPSDYELRDGQAEVSIRPDEPRVRARTPPKRNKGEVYLAQDREDRMEESFGWVGSYMAMPSPALVHIPNPNNHLGTKPNTFGSNIMASNVPHPIAASYFNPSNSPRNYGGGVPAFDDGRGAFGSSNTSDGFKPPIISSRGTAVSPYQSLPAMSSDPGALGPQHISHEMEPVRTDMRPSQQGAMPRDDTKSSGSTCCCF